MPVPYHFNYCGLVIYFEIRACDASSFVLFQDCLGWPVKVFYVSSPAPPGSAPGPTRPFPLPPSWALEAPGAPAGVHLARCAPGRSRARLLAAAEAAGARGRGGKQTPGSPPLPLRPSHRRPGPFRLLGDPQRVCLGKRMVLSTVSACLLPLSLPAPSPLRPPPPVLLAPTCR